MMFGAVIKAIRLLKFRDVLATSSLQRGVSRDKTGEEKHHFKRIEMEQLKKIRQNVIKDMMAQIEALKYEIKTIDRGFSEDKESVKEELLQKIEQLKTEIEKIRKTIGKND
ncbi:uncharacterized protein [Drosophila pseudoobscura]|uniref:Uncharacterized protein n=1 Tax=Drosophila pseudoobscura pseudoobscura TaxID=46245 RepID=A0A6I8VF73_DROPS|nr:uncharacterized protein LOC26533314 [Drosophila pseudoobscura]